MSSALKYSQLLLLHQKILTFLQIPLSVLHSKCLLLFSCRFLCSKSNPYPHARGRTHGGFRESNFQQDSIYWSVLGFVLGVPGIQKFAVPINKITEKHTP